MATTLVVNPGSTSRKYALYKEGVLVRVLFFEETGQGFAVSDIENGTKLNETEITATDFSNAVSYTLTYLMQKEVINVRSEIDVVGVRVVAPGTHFTTHQLIDEAYIKSLEERAGTAPLHIPGLISELRAVMEEFSHAKIVGVSDSAFHATIPAHVSTVSIAKADAATYDIQRFGYHGLSFSSISRRLADTFGEVPKRTIVCHVGGGVSITALKDGVSVNTSMGYTPASGLIMSSRGGDVTAGVLATLIQKKKLHGEMLYEYLYKQSGFQGVAGVRDLRLVLERAAQEDLDAKLALDMFVHQVHSWIGAHVAQLGGLDAVVLTATAAERNPQVRSLLLKGLETFGVMVDDERNECLIGQEGEIGTKDSPVRVVVLKTDEMGEVVRAAEAL